MVKAVADATDDAEYQEKLESHKRKAAMVHALMKAGVVKSADDPSVAHIDADEAARMVCAAQLDASEYADDALASAAIEAAPKLCSECDAIDNIVDGTVADPKLSSTQDTERSLVMPPPEPSPPQAPRMCVCVCVCVRARAPQLWIVPNLACRGLTSLSPTAEWPN